MKIKLLSFKSRDQKKKERRSKCKNKGIASFPKIKIYKEKFCHIKRKYKHISDTNSKKKKRERKKQTK